ncbi:MAG: glycoside hydrolase family 2 TIM barrel-domain containing protein [bacterium]
MDKFNLDRKWEFTISGENSTVDLPHDYSIIQERDPDSPGGAHNGFFPGGVGKYKKTIYVPDDWKGKKVVLEFEGIYMDVQVHFNHQLVERHPYGYTSFHCDLTPYLKYDCDNEISVTVNNSTLPNTRWYSGSGIYRHVWLLTGEDIHIIPWGVYVTTPKVSNEESEISIETTVENSSNVRKNVLIRSIVLDEQNKEITISEIEKEIDSESQITVSQNLLINSTNLWSVESPYLYTVKSEVIHKGKVIDSKETKTGIRSISFDAQKGFKLNGKTMNLKGGCVHHDCGILGSASYDRAEKRKVELLKNSGFNAVRCAHNPPSPAFLDACDELGMMVIDEAFDCWRESKKINDYASYFENWWKEDIKSMIYRDRNHPSIIMWSTGNEIIERDGRSQGYHNAEKLADYVRTLDDTRAVTNALCGISPDPMISGLEANLLEDKNEDYDYWAEKSYKFVKPLDVVGYNYLLDRYEKDGEKYNNRIICGTETFPKKAFEYWQAVEKLPYVIGDFVWTGIDYLGEAGIGRVEYNGNADFLGDYPWHLANCGDIDICGFKRPQSYYRDCVWGIAKKPYIAVYNPENYSENSQISRWGWPDVTSSWTWNGSEGESTMVEVYSRGDEVELLLNGKSLGKKPAGKKNKYIASFELNYEPGELVAVNYKNGNEKSRSKLNTAGKPASIQLTPDRSSLNKEYGDLSYVKIEVLDSKNNLVHNASNNIFLTVSGVGSLLAVGSSDPMTEEMYVGNQRRVYQGRAMAVVRTEGKAGEIELNAAAEGIPAAGVTLIAE